MFWSKNKDDDSDRIKELENELEEVNRKVEEWKERYEKCDEKRSNLAREKQEAEEKLNKLENKLSSLQTSENSEGDRNEPNSLELTFQEFQNLTHIFEQVESNSKNLVSCYFNGSSEVREQLKSNLSEKWYNQISGEESFTGFFNDNLIGFVIKTRPFYSEKVVVNKNFDFSPLKEFVEDEKIWLIAETGESKIVKECNGEYEVLETIKNRVNRQHSKGGFSQSRFERKREEQISEHIKNVKKTVKDFDNYYTIGNKQICSKFNAPYLGGFNSNKELIDALYNFRFKKLQLKKG